MSQKYGEETLNIIFAYIFRTEQIIQIIKKHLSRFQNLKSYIYKQDKPQDVNKSELLISRRTKYTQSYLIYRIFEKKKLPFQSHCELIITKGTPSDL